MSHKNCSQQVACSYSQRVCLYVDQHNISKDHLIPFPHLLCTLDDHDKDLK